MPPMHALFPVAFLFLEQSELLGSVVYAIVSKDPDVLRVLGLIQRMCHIVGLVKGVYHFTYQGVRAGPRPGERSLHAARLSGHPLHLLCLRCPLLVACTKLYVACRLEGGLSLTQASAFPFPLAVPQPTLD